MKVGNRTFRGEQPRITPRELPENGAQLAINCRMQSGDLESWRQHLAMKVLDNTGPVQTIYLLDDEWLSWDEQVGVARSPIPGDDTYRVFLTCPALYATPRFTDYATATTGAEPFPVATRPLGVPIPVSIPTTAVGVDPTPGTFLIDVLDEGDSLATNWIASQNGTFGYLSQRHVLQDGTAGNATPSYKIFYSHNKFYPAKLARNFGVAEVAAFEMSFDFLFDGSTSGAGYGVYQQMIAICMANEEGAGLQVNADKNGIGIGTSAGWSITGIANLTTFSAAFADDEWYTVSVSVVVNSDRTKTASVSVVDSVDAAVASLTCTLNFTSGDYCGFIAERDTYEDYLEYATFYDNIHVQASGSTGYTPNNVGTSYVYTFKNDLGQESAPSQASATILRPDGVSVTVTTPTIVPPGSDPDYLITTKVIYRSVSGAGGTAFLKVDEIPLAQADYVDVLPDNEVGPAVLESEDWDPPPDDLEGIITLPNGIMAGFFKNQLCLSEQDRPHAWPVKYRKTTDTDIVAIANIDNTVVIGTKSFVYTATGNTPDGFSMSKPGAAQSCVSKRGMVFLDNVGVVFPSPDGYQVCAGSAGNVNNLTEQIFTRRQWQALAPETIIAAVHDSVLHFFYDNGEPAGMALDGKAGGFGLIRLSYHATAVHADPITDHLYLVLDESAEPADELLPLPSTEVTPTGTTIFQFDGSESNDMVFQWRGRLNLCPYPLHMAIAQARAQGYENLLLRIYADGALILEKVLGSNREFVVPRHKETDEYDYELIGTSRARSFFMAEDVMELP